jgi:hypothetical protein
MTLAEFVAIIGGALTQLGLLFANNGQNSFSFLQKKDEDTLVATPISDQQAVLLFGGITLITSLILDQFGFGSVRLHWVDELFTYTIAIIFVFILFSALAGDKLLPRVNEQQMLVIHLVVGINLLINSEVSLPNWALVLLLIPTAALIFQGIWSRALPTLQRAFFYLWYLITLVALAFQNGGLTYFEMVEISVTEIFIFGSLLVFLGMHMLVAMRFVLIISSLIFPRNRPLLKIMMPHLVHDEQLSIPGLLLILGLAAGVLVLKSMGQLNIDQTLINVFVLAMLQIPKDISSIWTKKAV